MKKSSKKGIILDAPVFADFAAPDKGSVFLELGRGVVGQFFVPQNRKTSPQSDQTGFTGRFFLDTGLGFFPMERGAIVHFPSLPELYDTRDCTRSLAYSYFPESRDTRSGAVGFVGTFEVNDLKIHCPMDDGLDMYPYLKYMFMTYGQEQTQDGRIPKTLITPDNAPDEEPPTPQRVQAKARFKRNKSNGAGPRKKKNAAGLIPLSALRKIKGKTKKFGFVGYTDPIRPPHEMPAIRPWLSLWETNKAKADKKAQDSCRVGAEKCEWSAGTAAESTNISVTRPDINSPLMAPLGFILGS